MLYREYQPSSCLKPYVKCYWTLQMHGLPDFESSLRFLAESFEFTFNLAAPIQMINCDGRIKRISHSGITGPMSKPMRFQPTGPLNLFGVCFRAGGGYPFFKYPAHELVNQYPDVGDLWGSSGTRFVEYIKYACDSTESRINAFNDHLAGRLAAYGQDDVKIQVALEIIERSNGHITIDQLARRLAMSNRNLTRKFKERIGVTPKQLCRNVRFKQVYKRIETGSCDNWADMALACGYYDQSHLINEFKYFTGNSPAAYFFSPAKGPDFFTENF